MLLSQSLRIRPIARLERHGLTFRTAVFRPFWSDLDQSRYLSAVGTYQLVTVKASRLHALIDPLTQWQALRPCSQRGVPSRRPEIVMQETLILALKPLTLQADLVRHLVKLGNVTVAPHMAPRPAVVVPNIINVDGHDFTLHSSDANRMIASTAMEIIEDCQLVTPEMPITRLPAIMPMSSLKRSLRCLTRHLPHARRQ